MAEGGVGGDAVEPAGEGRQASAARCLLPAPLPALPTFSCARNGGAALPRVFGGGGDC